MREYRLEVCDDTIEREARHLYLKRGGQLAWYLLDECVRESYRVEVRDVFGAWSTRASADLMSTVEKLQNGK